MSRARFLDCGIPVVDRYTKGVYFPPEESDYPIILLRDVKLRVAACYPNFRNKTVNCQLFENDGMTALEFHGGDPRSIDFRSRKWLEKSRNVQVADLLREVEREVSLDSIIACNLTPEDIGRKDLIYVVRNWLNVGPLDEPVEGGKMDLLVFPFFSGGGYISIKGVKYSIPKSGEDSVILE